MAQVYGYDPEHSSNQAVRNTQVHSTQSGGYMVVTANRHGSEAAEAILKAGGNALDAALAAAFALNVAEPQSSGIGGSGFLLYYNGKTLDAFEGRETAPKALPIDAFLDENKNPLGFREASNGGLAVGVPGFLMMASNAHQKHGGLDWSTLFQPAIALAKQGFEASPRMRISIKNTPQINHYSPKLGLVKNGEPITGIYKNPSLANTLQHIGANGIADFYEGELATRIVAAVRNNGGVMTLEDLKTYRTQHVEVLCGDFLTYQICGLGLPTGGGRGVLRALELLEQPLTNLNSANLNSANLNSAQHHLEATGATIAALSKVYEERKQWGNSVNTTHIVVVDEAGNVASLTASIGPAFGSLVATDGFLLNGEMTDFNFKGTGPNRIRPNAKPLSSQSPIIAFENEQPVLAAGSAGGSNIISYLVRVVVETLGLGMHPSRVLANPNFSVRGNKAYAEEGFSQLETYLRQNGHDVAQNKMTSGISLITKGADGKWLGVADPRREGIAIGGTTN